MYRVDKIDKLYRYPIRYWFSCDSAQPLIYPVKFKITIRLSCYTYGVRKSDYWGADNSFLT